MALGARHTLRFLPYRLSHRQGAQGSRHQQNFARPWTLRRSRGPVIGPRPFLDRSNRRLAAAYFAAWRRRASSARRALSRLGSAKGDSHGTLPFIHASYDELWKRDCSVSMIFAEGYRHLSATFQLPTSRRIETPASLSPFFPREVIAKTRFPWLLSPTTST
jgi:hypothetical protein